MRVIPVRVHSFADNFCVFLLSFPTGLIGNPGCRSRRGHLNGGEEEKGPGSPLSYLS